MKNLWPDKFEENQQASAKTLLEEQAKLLLSITGGVVYANVSELDIISATQKYLKNDFAYRFDIFGKFLKDYRFNVLCFSHDITLYPVKFVVDDGIGKELGLNLTANRTRVSNIESQDDLEPFLESVLKSDRLRNVIGSIVRLSH